LILDEDGAQYSADLSRMLGIELETIHSRLNHATSAGVIGHERRKRNGHTHSLWYLTSKAEATLQLIRAEVAS
jgi:predicted ArsR family transcriptional regulator